MTKDDIITDLFHFQDFKYREFQQKLIPSVKKDSIIGVRSPRLRILAKQFISKEKIIAKNFLESLPHKYFEEDQIHMFIISLEEDFDTCLNQLNTFLPFINNWATCDQLSPKIFKKHHKALFPYILKWLNDERCYTVRFGISMLMKHFLDDDFRNDHLSLITSIHSEEYYVNMMRAWYVVEALVKQYKSSIMVLEQHQLDDWTHNRTIKKAIESHKITDIQKEYIKSLRIKQ